jgi:hypothetical protein
MRTRPEPGQPILIEIGDQVLELKYPMRVLKKLAAVEGINVLGGPNGEGMKDVFNMPDRVALLLWYGLQTKHPEITQDWLDDHIEAPMLRDLGPSIGYAMTGRWPKVDEDEDAVPNPTEEGRALGSPSGPSDDTTFASPSANSGGSR